MDGSRVMEFPKYRKWGDYHWTEFRRPSIYRDHALWVSEWATEPSGLDLGCGDGLITHLLGDGWEGIDADPLAVELAKKHGVRASVGDVMTFTGEWDAIYFGDVIEHLEDPETAVRRLAPMTPALYLATPPRLAKLRPGHVREWTADELPEFMQECGWTLDGTIRHAHDRLYGRFTR